MKTLLLLFVLLSGTAFGQKQYFTFCIENSYGIADEKGKIVLAPGFFLYAEDFEQDRYIVLNGFLPEPGFLFDKHTGKGKKYEHIEYYSQLNSNEYYYLCKTKKSSFLLNAKNGSKIKLQKKYNSIFNEDRYDFAFYNSSKPIEQDSIITEHTYFPPGNVIDVFKDNDFSKSILTIDATRYYPLFKASTDTLGIGSNNDRQGFVIENKNAETKLYNTNMQLIGSFPQKSYKTQTQLDSLCSQLMSKPVVTPVSTSIRTEVNDTPLLNEKELSKSKNYPFLRLEEYGNGYVVILEKSEKDIALLFKTNKKLIILPLSNRIDEVQYTIPDQEQGLLITSFKVDKFTGELFFPEKYFELLGIKLFSKSYSQF